MAGSATKQPQKQLETMVYMAILPKYQSAPIAMQIEFSRMWRKVISKFADTAADAIRKGL